MSLADGTATSGAAAGNGGSSSSARAPPGGTGGGSGGANARGFTLEHQRVALEFRFDGIVEGYTEMTIVPTDAHLKTIHVNCRQAGESFPLLASLPILLSEGGCTGLTAPSPPSHAPRGCQTSAPSRSTRSRPPSHTTIFFLRLHPPHLGQRSRATCTSIRS